MPIIVDYSTGRRTIRVADVLSRVSYLLNDESSVRWTQAERIDWGNEAMAAIINRRPDAFAVRAVVPLIGGSYQTIPETATLLLDVVRNISADGATPGRSIRRSDRQLLDDSDPDWHSVAPKAQVRQFTFDDRVPTVFYVYPPVITGTKVELMVAQLPDPLVSTDAEGSYELGPEYAEALVNYICYRARSKDSEEGSIPDASAFYAAFTSALGEKGSASTATSPNQPTSSV